MALAPLQGIAPATKRVQEQQQAPRPGQEAQADVCREKGHMDRTKPLPAPTQVRSNCLWGGADWGLVILVQLRTGNGDKPCT